MEGKPKDLSLPLPRFQAPQEIRVTPPVRILIPPHCSSLPDREWEAAGNGGGRRGQRQLKWLLNVHSTMRLFPRDAVHASVTNHC